MSDHGLDLAVIGNGHRAALVDPSSRMVWWCFPRFDSDPVFCRLLAGNEENGLADVVLDGCVEGAAKLQAEILSGAWNCGRKAFTVAIGSDEIDASVLLLPQARLD